MRYLLLFAVLLIGSNSYCQITEDSTDEIAFAIIENVPLYKGCDESMSNDEKRQCMSDKVSELISKNFNTKLGAQLDLPAGNIKISVIFKINTEGHIENIQARAKHPALEKEAVRVIKLIPKMDKAGMQLGKPVVVPYSLPIVFKVEGKGDEILNRTFPLYRGCNEKLEFEALRECTTERIMDFIKVSRTIDPADELFPTDRSTEFEATFVIDKKGKIKNINVKAYKREMAVLVIRALQQLPKMKAPGTINGNPVDVPFKFKMTLYFD